MPDTGHLLTANLAANVSLISASTSVPASPVIASSPPGCIALRDVPVVRSREERAAGQWRDYAAAKIIAQLKLGNWIIRKGESLKP